ncbi:hypothetical protein JCGZ_11774 [Jatropha curcas]|uniref:Uncharacterized protein n=1 Tax=Jatropha curcas TaxID=180498 RepID=A0A067K8Q6_JATCU|nr:uncharacterized protein LOC119369573 [Jatropha curcas]KDP31398.1 hypothetical protein JCGZ_11774 [Jatropha curcas]
MASTRFISFLLIIFIVLHYVRNSSALMTRQGAAATMDGVSKTRLGGRKVIKLKRVLIRKEEAFNKEEVKISGATKFVGSYCNYRSSKCKLMSNRGSSHGNLKDKREVFTAFSSDYHVPKSHPPKNN